MAPSNPESLPTVEEVLADPSASLQTIMVVVGVLGALSILMCCVFFCTNVGGIRRELREQVLLSSARRSRFYIMLMMPAFVVYAATSLFVPRLGVLAHAFAVTIQAVAMNEYMFSLFYSMGGPLRSMKVLNQLYPEGRKWFSGPPVCCLRPCTRRRKFTVGAVRFIRRSVLQAVVLRPSLYFLWLAALANADNTGVERVERAVKVLGYLMSASSLLAIVGFRGLLTAMQPLLKGRRPRIKFFAIQGFMIFDSLNNVLIAPFVEHNVDDTFRAGGALTGWSAFAMSLETFLMCILVLVAFPSSEVDKPLPLPEGATADPESGRGTSTPAEMAPASLTGNPLTTPGLGGEAGDKDAAGGRGAGYGAVDA